MPPLYQAPQGTQDLLPEDASAWRFVENTAREQAGLAGFEELRTPTFEQTAVFVRAVGAATDIVEKEIYSFTDKGGEQLTLRPEGTAAVVRAYLEHGMSSRPQPVRVFSLINAFRHDRPQRGRYREFHQFNVEAIGEADPLVDAEVLAVQWRFYAALGLRDLTLEVNSIGDAACRPAYVGVLRTYFEEHRSGLCPDCQRRLETNPLRLLDEKNPACRPVIDQAPRSSDYLCGPCREHFTTWLEYLDVAGIPYTVSSRLVRGLDYYTRSVWEVLPPREGAQSTLGGGGRYDGLAEQLGGRPTPGVGFATGLERVLLEMRQQQVPMPRSDAPALYLVWQGAAAKRDAFATAERLRRDGIAVEVAAGDRKLGKQLGAADRSGAAFAGIIGDDEVAAGSVTLKPLRVEAPQRTVARDEVAIALKTLGEDGWSA